MRRLLFGVLLVVAATGCETVPAVPIDIGGSRADGTVVLAVDSVSRSPQIDWKSGESLALARCLAWGYSDASPFGGLTVTCLETRHVTVTRKSKSNCFIPNTPASPPNEIVCPEQPEKQVTTPYCAKHRIERVYQCID